ncbi:MAG: tRNA-intron lyase [Methanomicrobiales archaeon]|nr:tRNA-intron lyase [Methanomicrobiales archaeon]
MNATLDGNTVRLGPEALSLHQQGGYGRVEAGGLRLAPEEALYLVQRQKIRVEGWDFDRMLAHFSGTGQFLRSYLVYRDLRERGYAVQPGPQDYRVFRRGDRPGSGKTRYLVRVLSERDLVDFEAAGAEVATSSHMRKEYVLAVVDDEDELTYYGVKASVLPEMGKVEEPVRAEGELLGTAVLIRGSGADALAQQWYGTRLDEQRLLLAPAEACHLVQEGILTVPEPGGHLTPAALLDRAAATDSEIREKVQVYSDLRRRGYTPRTGYKFGHHFRVYTGDKTHSDLLVHALPPGVRLPMSAIARSVRLAHSVKKKMLFGCVQEKGIRYIEFGRIKL